MEMSNQRKLRMGAAGAVLALLLAACAKNSSTPPASGSGASSRPSEAAALVKSATVSGVGTVLVNSAGRTLYTLSADQGGKVTCTSSACTSVWPPLLLPSGTSAPTGSGVTSTLLGTVKTPSGQMQVTYNNWPLYTFSGDSGPGQAKGQGINSFGGVWHPMGTSGQRVTGSSSSGGGGY